MYTLNQFGVYVCHSEGGWERERKRREGKKERDRRAGWGTSKMICLCGCMHIWLGAGYCWYLIELWQAPRLEVGHKLLKNIYITKREPFYKTFYKTISGWFKYWPYKYVTLGWINVATRSFLHLFLSFLSLSMGKRARSPTLMWETPSSTWLFTSSDSKALFSNR